jgi:hypothetical protein
VHIRIQCVVLFASENHEKFQQQAVMPFAGSVVPPQFRRLVDVVAYNLSSLGDEFAWQHLLGGTET